MTESDDDFIAGLVRRAGEDRKRIVFPEGDDPRVQRAARALAEEGTITPVLIGPAETIGAWRAELAPDLEVVTEEAESEALRAATHRHLEARRAGRKDAPEKIEAWSRDPLHQAAALVAEGRADGVVAGCVRTTADVVRAGLVGIGMAEGVSTLSSAFYMVRTDGGDELSRVLTFTDAGVVPAPDAEALAGIAIAAARARAKIVGDEPRVAFLSYSTKGSAEGQSVSVVREGLRLFREAMPHVRADGEIQGDAALSPDVADRKAPGSPLEGRANVLVFPDLDAANIAYKLVQYVGGAIALGPILQGLRQPMNDLSRGASTGDIRAVACITALMAG
ncbi:MAG: phosphate acyltransferase [Gemmatimonadota bacterium]